MLCGRTRVWLCTQADCKLTRAVFVNSSKGEDFTCQHVQKAKDGAVDPVQTLRPKIDQYPCSDEVAQQLRAFSADVSRDVVIHVSPSLFAVFGPSSASNPLGYCHVKKVNSRYLCCGKDCRSLTSKGKQSKTTKPSASTYIWFCPV